MNPLLPSHGIIVKLLFTYQICVNLAQENHGLNFLLLAHCSTLSVVLEREKIVMYSSQKKNGQLVSFDLSTQKTVELGVKARNSYYIAIYKEIILPIGGINH